MRFHLHDDEILAARGAEVRSRPGAQRRPLGEPRASVGDLSGGGGRSEQRPVHVGPHVVGVIAERPELFHHRAVPEHLLELAAAQDRRRGDRGRHDRNGESDRRRQPRDPVAAFTPVVAGSGRTSDRIAMIVSHTANGMSMSSQIIRGVNRL